VLVGFTKSERYGAQARQIALPLLWKTEYAPLFESMFNSMFEPVSWQNLAEILTLDRALNRDCLPLARKAWDADDRNTILSRLTNDEQARWDNLHVEFDVIVRGVGPLLRRPRPTGLVLDLHGTNLFRADLSGTDLSGADLTGAMMSNVLIKGANLSGVTEFYNLAMVGTAWWQAAAMSKELLEHLEKNDPFEPDRAYTSKDPITQESMQKDVERLRRAAK
jgi:hypothetical protein